MRWERKIERRRFLRELLGSSACLVWGPSRLLSDLGLGAGPGSSLLQIVGEAGHGESAEAVGREYLRSRPLERLLLAACRWTGVLLGLGPPEGDGPPGGRKVEMIRRRIRRDFDRGRTVEVGGWILSLTEARLCALVALSAS